MPCYNVCTQIAFSGVLQQHVFSSLRRWWTLSCTVDTDGLARCEELHGVFSREERAISYRRSDKGMYPAQFVSCSSCKNREKELSYVWHNDVVFMLLNSNMLFFCGASDDTAGWMSWHTFHRHISSLGAHLLCAGVRTIWGWILCCKPGKSNFFLVLLESLWKQIHEGKIHVGQWISFLQSCKLKKSWQLVVTSSSLAI